MSPDLAEDRPDTVVLDLDGTLVDSVYHHVVAWQTAFEEVGMRVPTVEIHSAIGLSGDRLVPHLRGDCAEDAVGDTVRAAHDRHFEVALRHVTPLDGANELLEWLRQQGLWVVVASSGGAEPTEQLLSLIENRGMLHAVVSGAQTSRSKPAPEPVRRAVEAVGGRRAIVVGDAVWDMHSATAAGHRPVGVLSGGVSRESLQAAGASRVYDGPQHLLDSWRTRAME